MFRRSSNLLNFNLQRIIILVQHNKLICDFCCKLSFVVIKTKFLIVCSIFLRFKILLQLFYGLRGNKSKDIKPFKKFSFIHAHTFQNHIKCVNSNVRKRVNVMLIQSNVVSEKCLKNYISCTTPFA
jgi:hypothetical protein